MLEPEVLRKRVKGFELTDCGEKNILSDKQKGAPDYSYYFS